MVCASASSSSLPSIMCFGRLTDPRLQTAVSSGDVFSVISVQRLELWITPQWSCGDLILHASLKVIQGWPVSKSMLSILRQSFLADTSFHLRILPSRAACSYPSYLCSNFLP